MQCAPAVAGAPTRTSVLIERASETHTFRGPHLVGGRFPRVRFLDDDDVRLLLPPPAECVDLVAAALVALAAGRAEVPPKPAVHAVPGSFANAMPASWPERGLLGCKWISIFPDNHLRGPAHRLGPDGGQRRTDRMPVCIMPAGELTAARTAAVSGACVRALSPASVGHVAITGAGVQARSHLRVLEASDASTSRSGRAARARSTTSPSGPPPRRRGSGCEPRPTSEAVPGAAVVVTALSIGLTGAELDPPWVPDGRPGSFPSTTPARWVLALAGSCAAGRGRRDPVRGRAAPAQARRLPGPDALDRGPAARRPERPGGSSARTSATA